MTSNTQTAVAEAAQTVHIVPVETQAHAQAEAGSQPGQSSNGRRFGLTSPWDHYYHPIDTKPQGRFECEMDDMVVFGEIPPQISGTWYRIIIDPHFTPKDDIPFVDGDGLVSAFRIQDGKVSMKLKYVETERWLLERKAGRRLFGRYRNPFDNHPCVRFANDSTGNTNIIYWAGKVLTLAERGLPWYLDPDTLETQGADPFGGQVVAKTFCAHPKVDPVKNELVTWSYAAKGLSTPDVCTYTLDSNGRVHNEHWFKQDVAGWPHDGWITENWLILSNMPYGINSDEEMKAGGDYWRYMPDQASELLVTPRNVKVAGHPNWKPGEFRKYLAPHGLLIHCGNAWEEEGGILKLESHYLTMNVFNFFNAKDYTPPKAEHSGDWIRWTLDLSQPSGSPVASYQTLLKGTFDFPIFDERKIGQKTKMVYLAGMIPEERARPVFNAAFKLNTETGEHTIFRAPEGGFIGEPAYIPRGPDCEEGDGWIMFYMASDTAIKGELVILDVKDFQNPIAIVQMPFALRDQVHGNWVPNPHPETPLPMLSRPVRDVTPSTGYSQLNRLA